MRRLKTIFQSLFLLLIVSCHSADSKIPALAADMCGCFDTLKTGLSTETLAVLEKVKDSPDPQKTLQEELAKLAPETAQQLIKTLSEMGNSSSSTSLCMEAIDKKYGKETTTDKKLLMQKVANEMTKNKDCLVGAAIIKLGAKNMK